MRAAASLLVALALAVQAVPAGAAPIVRAPHHRHRPTHPRVAHARFTSDADVTSAVRGVFTQLAPNPDPGNLEPQPVTDLGLQPGPGGTVLRYPLANTVLPSGFSVLNVTLVDQSGKPVAIGGSTGGTAASAQTFPVDASGRQVISPSTLPTPPAVQPVSGTVAITAASPVPVTLPSGPLAVTVSNPVTPPPVQPVSIASPVAVTGAFPTPLAVQPISAASPLAVTIASPVPVTIASPLAVTQSGAFAVTAASPLPVTVATTLPVSLAQTVPVSAVGTFPVSAPSPLPIAAVPIGGPFLPIPVPTANGTPLVSGPTGIELSVQPGASVTYGCFASAPTAPPAQTRTVANPATATIYVSDAVNTAAGVACYLTAATTSTGAAVTSANASSAGTPFYRSI